MCLFYKQTWSCTEVKCHKLSSIPQQLNRNYVFHHFFFPTEKVEWKKGIFDFLCAQSSLYFNIFYSVKTQFLFWSCHLMLILHLVCCVLTKQATLRGCERFYFSPGVSLQLCMQHSWWCSWLFCHGVLQTELITTATFNTNYWYSVCKLIILKCLTHFITRKIYSPSFCTNYLLAHILDGLDKT